MPGIVALYYFVGAAICGLFTLVIGYLLLRLTPIKRRLVRLAVAAALGTAVTLFLLWDFQRYNSHDLDLADVEPIVSPVLKQGTSYRFGYSYVSSLSYGTVLMLQMSDDEFRRFIANRPHDPVEVGSLWHLEPILDPLPEKIRDFECISGEAYQPNYAANYKLKEPLEIDEYSLFYCDENQTLFAIKANV